MFDPTSRFTQALAPTALATLGAGLNAIVRAIDECQRGQADPEHDPAVLLLARHIGSLALEGLPPCADLRRTCIEAVGTIERTPLLLTLARRGVDYDADAKAAFHKEGGKAMMRLATTLGLQRGEYKIRSNPAGIACSGEITLHAPHIYIQLGLGCMGPGHAVMFRSCDGLADYRGGANHFGSIAELLDPAHFAARIRRELGLAGTPDMLLLA